MEAFRSSVSKCLEIGVKIAPYLRDILKLIVQGHNGPDVKPEQWKLIIPPLEEFQSKLVRMNGGFAEISNNLEITTENFIDRIQCMQTRIENDIIPNLLLCAIDHGEHQQLAISQADLRMYSNEIKISQSIPYNPEPLFMNATKNISLRLLEDSLFGLSRIFPSRPIARSGSLAINTKAIFIHLGWEDDFEKIDRYMVDLYNIFQTRNSDKTRFYTFHLKPEKEVLSGADLVHLFGKEIHELTVFDLYLDINQRFRDENFHPQRIWESIVGSQLHSIQFSIELCSLIYTEIGIETKGVDINYLSRFKEYHLNDIYDICIWKNLVMNKKGGLTSRLLSDKMKDIMFEINLVIYCIKYSRKFDRILEFLLEGKNYAFNRM